MCEDEKTVIQHGQKYSVRTVQHDYNYITMKILPTIFTWNGIPVTYTACERQVLSSNQKNSPVS